MIEAQLQGLAAIAANAAAVGARAPGRQDRTAKPSARGAWSDVDQRDDQVIPVLRCAHGELSADVSLGTQASPKWKTPLGCRFVCLGIRSGRLPLVMTAAADFTDPAERRNLYRRLLAKYQDRRATVTFTYPKPDGTLGVGRALADTPEDAARAALRLYPAATIAEPSAA